MEARRRWINLSNGGDPSRLMKSRVKCRIEWAGIKYLLGRLGKTYIYWWGSLFSGAKGVKFGCYMRASFNKNAGVRMFGELKLCVEEGVVLFWMESCRPMGKN